MATTGMDGYVKCWDVRTSRMLHAYTTLRPAHTPYSPLCTR